MITPDPRITPARPDLAARHLEGRVAAARYVDGTLLEVFEPQAPVRRAPAPDAPLDTEALKGERVTIYETTDEGWCWGQLEADGYVGYLPAGALAPPGPPATHKVAALRTFAFPGPSIKLPPLHSLSLGCRLAIVRMEKEFAVDAAGAHVPACHVVPVTSMEEDFVAVAERFVGTPYLWGGKTSLGLDCSGLVQVALTASGFACPRDSDMQARELGDATEPGVDFERLRRGDLLFWKGHVAIVRDAATIVHANAHHMAVAVEPVTEALTRIAAAGCAFVGVRRLR
ncbi:NlpC/P60 family protein [Xanthobacteraceae bacterium Astr-EGSB]|uniref:C40 family peptidase n=1 Tax=Astrobacterium formosum TaxID=3069710 RepID=UPI0027B2FC9D|nr:NlpC/P60 family protein [Xanthobacteraceae bacterium Astr-EGSB]